MGAEQYSDCVLHGLVVDAEDDVAEQCAQLRFFGGDDLEGARIVARLRGDAQLESFDTARKKRQRRVTGRVELTDAVGQQFRECGFALAPGAQCAAHDRGRLTGAIS